MANRIARVNVNADTFESWITKTNNIIDSLQTEILTANSTLGITGSAVAPRNAQLFGGFTANTLTATQALAIGGLVANATHVVIGSSLVANGSSGTSGQVLTSNGTGIYWTTTATNGTVTQVNTGSGLSGGPITANGTITVNAQTGLVANTSGLYVNTAYIQSLIQIAPPSITGDLNMNNNDIVNVDNISSVSITNSGSIRSTSYLIGPTLGHTIFSADGNTVGLRINDATTGPTFLFNAAGINYRISVPANLILTTAGQDRLTITSGGQFLAGGIELGFKTIPQVTLNISTPISTNDSSGRHIYKTTTSAIVITVPDNSTESCVIGTTITIINDGATGNITLAQGGSTVLQLGGSFITGNRTITPGGFATMLKVATNKWIVTGPGVS